MSKPQGTPSRRGIPPEQHRFWQQSVAKEEYLQERANASSSKRCGSSRSRSTPALRPLGPYGLQRDDGATRLPPIDEAGVASGRGSPTPGAVGAFQSMVDRNYAPSTASSSRSSLCRSLRSRGLGTGADGLPPATGSRAGSAVSSRSRSRLSSASSLGSSASALALQQEIGSVVKEQVALALQPIAEKLEVERAARQRAEALLKNAGAPVEVC
mmetsp:Transcript_29891/g.82063  ORF Transcript_29891/g.82063 Transcript_29891/m.82063 type:complete len:213 (+) Transcript_29891:57-695(+)